MINEIQWRQYEEVGYLNLGKVATDQELAALSQRIDDIMLGRAPLDYNRLMMQLDSTSGKYDDAGEQSLGFKGSTLGYRKIQGLEIDDLFGAFVTRDVFRDICAHVYGPQTSIACFRAMFMNKPSNL